MNDSDALAIYAYATELWRFLGKWSPAQVRVFTDGLRRIKIDTAQARACLDEFARTTEKTPTLAAIVKRLRSLVPAPDRGLSPSVKSDEPAGPGYRLHEYVGGIASGSIPWPEDMSDAGLKALREMVARHQQGQRTSLFADLVHDARPPRHDDNARRTELCNPAALKQSPEPSLALPSAPSPSSPLPSSTPSSDGSDEEFEREVDEAIGKKGAYLESLEPVGELLPAPKQQGDPDEW